MPDIQDIKSTRAFRIFNTPLSAGRNGSVFRGIIFVTFCLEFRFRDQKTQ